MDRKPEKGLSSLLNLECVQFKPQVKTVVVVLLATIVIRSLIQQVFPNLFQVIVSCDRKRRLEMRRPKC